MKKNFNLTTYTSSNQKNIAIKDLTSIRSDRGFISVSFAILFSSLVIVGILALVIDISAMYYERKQLQKAADSAVLAIAQSCAKNSNNNLCNSELVGINGIWKNEAKVFVDLNSDDKKTWIDTVCGSGSPSLTACIPNQTPERFDCKSVQALQYPNYVRIKVSTEQTDGSRLLNLFFGRGLTGQNTGPKLKACAQATWQVPYSAPIIYPLALPICGFADSARRKYNAYQAGDVLSNPSVTDPLHPDYCAYQPIGGQLTIMNQPVVKGIALFTAVTSNPGTSIEKTISIGCPSPTRPYYISVGDVLTVIPNGDKNSVIDPCTTGNPSPLMQMGITQTGFSGYDLFLESFILNKPIYIPIMTGIYNGDEKKIVVGGFATYFVRGLAINQQIEVGCGPSGCTNSNTWKQSGNPKDCPNASESQGQSGFNYCAFGDFVRSAPPRFPRPTPSPLPSDYRLGLTQVSLIE